MKHDAFQISADKWYCADNYSNMIIIVQLSDFDKFNFKGS